MRKCELCTHHACVRCAVCVTQNIQFKLLCFYSTASGVDYIQFVRNLCFTYADKISIFHSLKVPIKAKERTLCNYKWLWCRFRIYLCKMCAAEEQQSDEGFLDSWIPESHIARECFAFAFSGFMGVSCTSAADQSPFRPNQKPRQRLVWCGQRRKRITNYANKRPEWFHIHHQSKCLSLLVNNSLFNILSNFVTKNASHFIPYNTTTQRTHILIVSAWLQLSCSHYDVVIFYNKTPEIDAHSSLFDMFIWLLF